MIFITTLFLIALLFLVLVFVDKSRPNKKEHIQAVQNDGPAGFFAWFNFIPLLLMSDSFTDWFNDYLPFLNQPYYKGEWYITAIIWIIWLYSNMAIISIPNFLFKWRVKHYKTQEEAKVEKVEHELSIFRNEVEIEEKQWEEQKKTYVYQDNLPF